MDTPALPPQEVVQSLEGMSFFQKRALKKAGFKWDGLHRLAAAEYGAGLVEAVLACHTELLGRPARADEPEKAAAAQRHPGVSAVTSWGGPGTDGPRYIQESKERRDEVSELLAQSKARKKAAKEAEKEQRRRNPGGRQLP